MLTTPKYSEFSLQDCPHADSIVNAEETAYDVKVCSGDRTVDGEV